MNKEELAPLLVSMQNELVARAYQLTRDRSRSEELALDTIERANRYAESFDGDNLKAWLFTILRNLFNNEVRVLVREDRALLSIDEMMKLDIEPESSVSAEYEALFNTFSPEVQEAFSHLTNDQKIIVYLIDIQGFSYAEASEYLHIEKGTVMSRLNRARVALRKELA